MSQREQTRKDSDPEYLTGRTDDDRAGGHTDGCEHTPGSRPLLHTTVEFPSSEEMAQAARLNFIIEGNLHNSQHTPPFTIVS